MVTMKLAATVFLAVLAFLLILPLAGRAVAEDASTCYTISDADARTYCLARAHKDPARCYAVQRADLRAQCLAEVRR